MASYHDARVKILTGNANPDLAQRICDSLGLPLGQAEVGQFSNGETKVIINENVRGTDVFIVQSTCNPVNDALMELLLLVDAAKRASARRITAVVPFYGYARQDRKTRGREPISAKLVANLITTAGATRVLTMDLHAGQIQGFFDIPLDHLTGIPIIADYFASKKLEDAIVVSPDLGGVGRARTLAERLNVPIAIIDKRRPEPNVAEVMNVIGKVKGKSVIMIDDMIDTGGTIVLGAKALLDLGAKDVYVACTHPVFSGPAVERLDSSPIKELVALDTIPLTPAQQRDKFTILSVAPLLGEAIVRIHEDLSISKLFTDERR
jgi:ribose-phosphate pyrophosphokinase